MPSNYSLNSVIEKNSIDSDVPMLMALKVDVVDPDSLSVVETICIVANTENINIFGEEYIASPFSVELEETTEDMPTASITIIDITQTVQSYMQKYKGGNGTKVTLYIFYAPSTNVNHVETEYTFDVKSSRTKSSDYSVTWQIGAENPITQPLPARKQMRERCQWRYKGEECGYVGELPTCDLSLDGDNGCRVHENQTRFGGFPGIQVRNI
tara:strand:+ start:577 stop:1209 length:633 start_codon:yes stop_codon:yes gene_type:complete